MIESTCRECGETALLLDSFWDDGSKRFVRLFECQECGEHFKQSGHAAKKPRTETDDVDELELLKRVNQRLGELGGDEDE